MPSGRHGQSKRHTEAPLKPFSLKLSISLDKQYDGRTAKPFCTNMDNASADSQSFLCKLWSIDPSRPAHWEPNLINCNGQAYFYADFDDLRREIISAWRLGKLFFMDSPEAASRVHGTFRYGGMVISIGWHTSWISGNNKRSFTYQIERRQTMILVRRQHFVYGVQYIGMTRVIIKKGVEQYQVDDARGGHF